MKNSYIYIGIGIAVLGVAAYFAFRTPSTDKITEEQTADELAKDPTGVFPLRKGKEGNEVRNLQSILQMPVNGIFDSATEAKLKSKYGKTEVKKADYDYFITLLKQMNYKFFE